MAIESSWCYGFSLITVTMSSAQQSNHGRQAQDDASGMHGPIRRHFLEPGKYTAALTLPPIRSGAGGSSSALPPERLPSIQEILSRDDGFAKGALLVLLGFKSSKE